MKYLITLTAALLCFAAQASGVPGFHIQGKRLQELDASTVRFTLVAGEDGYYVAVKRDIPKAAWGQFSPKADTLPRHILQSMMAEAEALVAAKKGAK